VQQIDRLALSGSVHVMGEVTDLYPALAQMDAVVITSDHEGLPMLLLEAITLEVPVIAHAVGAIPHVLRAGEYGTLVVHQQAAAYAQAVSDLVVDPAPARTRARQGRQNLETLYSARTSAEKHHRLYRDLLRAERPAITCTTDSDALPGSERGDNTPPASRPRTRRTAR
jgi:glycosyltransferase involved in cell wall biosynthesis